MSIDPPSARWLVRELVGQASARSRTPTDLASVAFEACEHTYRDLARELGAMSAQALVNRAQAQAGLEHPALLLVRLYQHRESGGKVSAIPWSSDCTATAREFESLLEALLALLGRFVGINIVVRLLAPREPEGSTPTEDAR
jgi:hypothetical protein